MTPSRSFDHGSHSQPDPLLLMNACRQLYRCADTHALAETLLALCLDRGNCSAAAIYLVDPLEPTQLQRYAQRGDRLPLLPERIARTASGQAAALGAGIAATSTSFVQPLGNAADADGLLFGIWEGVQHAPEDWVQWIGQLADDAAFKLHQLRIPASPLQLQPILQSIQALSAVSQLGLLPAQPLERLAQALIQQLVDTLPLRAAALWLVDEPDQRLGDPHTAIRQADTHSAAASGLWSFPLRILMRQNADVCYHSERGVQIVTPEEPGALDLLQGLKLAAASAMITVSLRSAGRSIGVLQLILTAQQQADAQTIQLARVLAHQIAVSIDNARILVHTRANQERSSAVVDATNDAILMLDERQRVMIINRRARFFFGLSEHELIGKDYEQFSAIFGRIFAEGREFSHWMSHLLQSEREREVKEFHTIGNDSRLLQCFSAPVIDRHDRLLGRILVFRDITREREVERMKSEFVSTVSHELRTPLSSIQGALQLVLGNPRLNRAGIADELPPRAKSLLTISLNNTARLMRLINDILDVAKIEQGRIELHRDALAPFELCRSACDEVAALSSERDIQIHLRVGGEIPPVFADRDRIVQVLVNLLSNAIKFSASGQPVDVEAYRDGATICFAVRDYGRGIAEEDQARLFQKFQQVDSSSTRETGGTGLGLAISKALVEEHGGRIWLESAPHKGSTFYFTLPIARDTSLQPRGTRRVVLCVAQSLQRERLLEALQPIGNVVLVSEPHTLAERIRELQPDVIIVSDVPEDMEHLHLLRRLRNDTRQQGIPLVISSDRLSTTIDALVLPLESSTETMLQAVQQALAVHRPLVLIVDDDPHVRPVLARLLQRHGMRVRQAVDGYEGLAIAAQLRPEVILLDVLMPGIDGYEVLRRLRDDPSTAAIPVIILSANDPRDRAPNVLQTLDVADYLEKPISAERLTNAINHVIAGNRHG